MNYLLSVEPHTNTINMVNLAALIADSAFSVFQATIQILIDVVRQVKQRISCTDVVIKAEINEVGNEISGYRFLTIRQ